ncbi:hypothetical protein H8S90_22380 [Olivibacter sp. SDN3]|uniref:DUF4179 domain-containing protein n=1 Tax=Olivibacter sp. SDN3 TaxID=2764720 RepID=UPI0016519F06|nr:DUF4179 domain-containing protein [Olivibacter sp. SDN3]QNL49443.1 hypothetical protein H8S90_22380 [Olivibacter sp. SDN3]
MDNKNNRHQDWENKQITGILNSNPFIVPENYFNSLEIKIKQRIKVVNETKDFLKVPEGYFDTLQQRIHNRINQTELGKADDPSFVSELKNKAPTAGYTLPVDYFEGLTNKINRAVDSQTSKTVEQKASKGIKRMWSTWIGYAAAACLAITVGVYTFSPTNTPNSLQQRFHNIPENEIISYLEYYTEPADLSVIDDMQLEESFQATERYFTEEDIEAYLDYNI